jgi:hypothetical protein
MRRAAVERNAPDRESRTLHKERDATDPGRQLRDRDDASAPASAGNNAVQRSLTGAPLDPHVRAEMEARFGSDFSNVRVHDDAEAHQRAADLGAMAYTVGESISFGAERYAPQSGEGKRLLAHELAHVVQQRRGGPAPELAPNAPHERSADRAADQVAAGAGSVDVHGGTAVGVARAPVPKEKPFDPVAAEREEIARQQAERLQVIEDERAKMILSLVALRRRPHRFYKWHAHQSAVNPGFVYSATYALLGRYGFGTDCKVNYSVDDYLAEFDNAVRIWAAATKYRYVTHEALRAPIFDPEEFEHHMNQVILDELPDGTGYIGTRRDFKAAEQEQIKLRNTQTLQNITGGIGGAIGWGIAGDVGSDIGAIGDAMLTRGRTRGGVRGKNVSRSRSPGRSGGANRARIRQTTSAKKSLGKSPTPKPKTSAPVVAPTIDPGANAPLPPEPLVAVKIQGKNKGQYWREGTPEYAKRAGSTTKAGAPKKSPDSKYIVLPESEARQLGFRQVGEAANTAIEPRRIGGRQVESSGAGRRTEHPITARTARKKGRSTGSDIEAPKPNASAQHGFDRTIKADMAQSQGHNALIDGGELGILRANNVSTPGVDSITATVDGKGGAKIFLNDFTTPGARKGPKPSHKLWKKELLEATKEGRLDFGDKAVNDAIKRAVNDGKPPHEIYVRTVRVELPATAEPGPRPRAGTAGPKLTIEKAVKLR